MAVWSASAVYTQGMKVSYEGKIYEAKWWTQGETPSQSGQWGVWKEVGACDDDGGAPTDPTDPTDPADPGGPTDPTDPADPSSCAVWREGVTYQAGDVVSYSNIVYTALVTHTAHVGANWNPASTPTLWEQKGECDDGGNDPGDGDGDNPGDGDGDTPGDGDGDNPGDGDGDNPDDGGPGPDSGLPKHALIGYLHASFANGSGYVRMADVSNDWDVINLSFAEPTSPTSGEVEFHLCPVSECANVESEAEFKAAIRAKQAKGKKVLISIGGANGQVQLTSSEAKDAFVRSVSAIIDKYGLDGLDIDFEGHSLYLDSGDNDFRNPTTPVIVNLIAALKELKAKYGAGFVLTMAPETFFVQNGYSFYGSGKWGGADPRCGAYLPVIYAMRNDLTLLHVQDYNSGPIVGLDDQYHTMGTADFHVAMTDMLLAGFPVQKDSNMMFPALKQSQIAIGLPSSVNAGGGFTSVQDVQTALDCLMKKENCGTYQPKGVYPNMRGLMTWSINWDKFNDYEFSKSHKAYFEQFGL
ncbi:chitinase [Hahella sp. KA22]|uniref:chitinase n=1 Tax=Hahella sp. KA22 TaxID=1628392 RepID=UPI001AEFDC7C|nr:carbohydrate-binding protein [Hahella sp. KA22]